MTLPTARVVEQCAVAVGTPAQPTAIFDRVFVNRVSDAEGCRTILTALRAQPGNDRCADCHAARPEYASINLGVFLCSWCFGAHRDIGTHISRTKSIKLDTWRRDWLVELIRVGNARAAVVWEGDVHGANAARPAVDAGSNEDNLRLRKRFVRAKYEKQTFLRSVRHATSAVATPSSRHAQPASLAASAQSWPSPAPAQGHGGANDHPNPPPSALLTGTTAPSGGPRPAATVLTSAAGAVPVYRASPTAPPPSASLFDGPIVSAPKDAVWSQFDPLA
eukprot:m.44785 g.44785  ORF g.44785 m.44785 type:complete len:277 (-) comp6571_c0_seq1:1461-2291(-)